MIRNLGSSLTAGVVVNMTCALGGVKKLFSKLPETTRRPSYFISNPPDPEFGIDRSKPGYLTNKCTY